MKDAEYFNSGWAYGKRYDRAATVVRDPETGANVAPVGAAVREGA